MWELLNRLTIPILAFYGIGFVGLTGLFYSKKIRIAIAFAISLAIVLVASEYWEIPVFVAGFFGFGYWWPYPSFAFILHHIYTLALAILLVYLSKLKLSKKELFLLASGITLNWMLLVPKPIVWWSEWAARLVGLIIIAGVVYNGSALVRVESKSI